MQSSAKGKFKFNFFDVMVISIMIVFAVSAVYINVMSEKEATAVGSDGFEYLLKSEKMDDGFISLLSVGDTLFEVESSRPIGVITDISVGDCVEVCKDGENTVYTPLEGYSSVRIILSCNGTVYKDGDGVEYILINEHATRVGSDIKVRNTKLVFEAECLYEGGVAE